MLQSAEVVWWMWSWHRSDAVGLWCGKHGDLWLSLDNDAMLLSTRPHTPRSNSQLSDLWDWGMVADSARHCGHYSDLSYWSSPGSGLASRGPWELVSDWWRREWADTDTEDDTIDDTGDDTGDGQLSQLSMIIMRQLMRWPSTRHFYDQQLQHW